MNRILTVAAIAILAAPSTAATQTVVPPVQCGRAPAGVYAPMAWMFVGSQCTDLSSYLSVSARGTWSLSTPTLSVLGSTFRVNANYNFDPFITFGMTTTNSMASTDYAFLFMTPIVPGTYNNTTTTGGVSVTDGANGTGAVGTSSTYPNYVTGYGLLGVTPTYLGAAIGSSPCSASGVPFAVTTTCNYGTASNSFAPTAYNALEATLTYTQTGIGSVASFSGAVTLNSISTTVPEPASLALLATGLLALGTIVVRKRRA